MIKSVAHLKACFARVGAGHVADDRHTRLPLFQMGSQLVWTRRRAAAHRSRKKYRGLYLECSRVVDRPGGGGLEYGQDVNRIDDGLRWVLGPRQRSWRLAGRCDLHVWVRLLTFAGSVKATASVVPFCGEEAQPLDTVAVPVPLAMDFCGGRVPAELVLDWLADTYGGHFAGV